MSSDPLKRDLVEATNLFFARHWTAAEMPPEWNFSWNWCGAIPSFDLGGVYALFTKEKLLYVGLGASRGGGLYEKHGLSRRLMNHVVINAPKESQVSYVPRERWANLEIDLVATIGFSKWDYLAPALEDFLIDTLSPSENKVKRKLTP